MSKIIETDCGNITTLAGDEVPNEIIVTEDAKIRIQDLCSFEDQGTFLRVAVQAGGCTGFQYHFGFDTVMEADDVVTEWDGGKVVVDSMSIELMKGATIEYVKSIIGEHFKVMNNLATSTCGCGSSFGV